MAATSLYRSILEVAFQGGAHLTYSDGKFRHFTGTHWTVLSEDELGRIILLHLTSVDIGRQRISTIIREVITILRRATAGPPRNQTARPLPIINVANGELWIGKDGSVELGDHNPASAQSYCLNVLYDPAATCPLYDQALSETFAVSNGPANVVSYWHELAGYLLQPTRPIAQIIVGWGEGNDAKSSLARLLVDLLGHSRVAAMAVGNLADHFTMSHLAGKQLLLDDDVAVGTVLPDGLLKTISEAKIVTADPKYLDHFEFEVRALPFLLCNSVPRLLDRSPGFRRRLAVIPFERRFKPAEVDPTLFTRIAATEMSGVLNRSLAGLQRVIQRNWKFDPPEAVVQTTEAWWAEATGLDEGSTGVKAAQARGRRGQKARPLYARDLGAAIPDRQSRECDPDISVSLDLAAPTTRKSYAVQVQAEGLTVGVRVSQGPQRPKLTLDHTAE